MKISSQRVAASLLGMACCVSSASFADTPVKQVPAKAAPRAPLAKVGPGDPIH